ncbi:hypothetical protein [Sciscionella marina]|uniref:hypothetical protein n=1 Tax=Sciscionella marina TaxID=508770 RepID=UPI000374D1E0|nr:hypothetical protein [Sciscionella marina]
MVSRTGAAFLGGLMLANGVPHFLSGVRGVRYSCVLGNSAERNALAGVSAFALAGGLLCAAGRGRSQPVAAAAGALAISVFHARGGPHWLNTVAGRPNPEDERA